MPNLIDLNLGYNQIESIQASFFDLFNSFDRSTLRKLNLEHNLISKIDRDSFKFLLNLNELNFDNNQISNIESNAFETLTNLTLLRLNQNKIDSIDFILKGLSNLEELWLNNNRIFKISQISPFQGLTSLKQLHLVSNVILSFDKKALSGLINLEAVYLGTYFFNHICVFY